MVETMSFTKMVDTMYSLPFDQQIELSDLLMRNIALSRRQQFLESYRQAENELADGNLTFSSNIDKLKTLL
jgi:hypothetical protein